MVYSDIDDASVSDTTIIPEVNTETMNKEITENIIDAGMHDKIILSCVQHITKYRLS